MATALITGGSRGFGKALARDLASDGWTVTITGRNREAVQQVADALPGVIGIPGDIADPLHRHQLASSIAGGLDLLVNNASLLGGSPLPRLDAMSINTTHSVFDVNTISPLALTQLLLPALSASRGAVVNLSSDAAVEAYPGWGAYGASKAALDHLTAVLAEEIDDVRFYAFDPGDMRTAMHQEAFPAEDISDRPLPESVVPALLRLVSSGLPSGRYRAADLLTGVAP